MKFPPSITDIKESTILVDTNIIIYYSQRGFKERTDDILRKLLVENKNKLCVSNITGYELFRDIDLKHREYYAKLLNSGYLIPIDLNSHVLSNASIISNLCDQLLNKNKGPSLQDILIMASALAVKGGAYILTCDKKDYTEPLCLTAAYMSVPAEKGNGNAKFGVEHLYLMRVNEELISKYILDVKTKDHS